MSKLTITIRNNGPLFIAADDVDKLQLTDHTGALIPLPTGKGISLCRCGASKRKPFCDTSHRTIGFDGTLAATSSTPSSTPSGAPAGTPSNAPAPSASPSSSGEGSSA
ncbi:MAG: hypothetical protein ABS52_06720 [Gemmatimonadetes bacterium SCN 70-22]|nr:MAG: hypothetical protein ABS52_06720 [Gemmatimonadetes bacterium SCN 70-22]